MEPGGRRPPNRRCVSEGSKRSLSPTERGKESVFTDVKWLPISSGACVRVEIFSGLRERDAASLWETYFAGNDAA